MLPLHHASLVKKVLTSLILFLLTAHVYSQTTALPRSNPEKEGMSSQGIIEFLDAMAKSEHEMHSIMIVRHGYVVAEGWWKPYAADTKHTMYSVSKSFTATAIGFAVAENKLTVNDKVSSFFPDDLPDTAHRYLSYLKVKDLLTMSVGHNPEYTWNITSNHDNWVNAFLAMPILNEPGTKFLYNSAATYMLSAIIQKVTGQKLMDYLKPRLFDPLGITGIDWETDPRGINVGGWGLRLKTEDMAKFGQLFLQKGNWNGKQIIPQSWVAEASAKQIDQEPDAPQSKRQTNDWVQGYGYQMWRSRHNSYRGDGAYGQYIFVLPEQDAVIAITSETPNMQGVMNLVWQHLLPAFKQGTLPANAQATATLQEKINALGLPLYKGTGAPGILAQGKRFVMESASPEIKSLGLQIRDGLCKMEMETPSGAYVFNLKNDDWYMGETRRAGPYLVAGARNRLAGLSPFKVAGNYRWKDAKTLELRLCYVESPHTETITCVFDGDNVTVDVQTIFNKFSKRKTYKGSQASGALSGAQKDYPIKGISFAKVMLTDSFWLPRIKTNHTVTIPASFERCESTGRVKNFEMAAARTGKFCTRYPFDDTDIYKTIEGASYSLTLFPDKKLESYIDSLIMKIEKAQESDGYLFTARTIDPQRPPAWVGLKRWEKERELSHELYNAGHLYEAAVAHYQATGKKNLLNIAIKNADLVCSVFGPGKLHVAPGHQVVEMGLVKMYQATGKPEYLETARFFIDERGHYNGYDAKSKDVWKNGSYWQDHVPVTEQREAVGHAVRAGYLYAGMADVAAFTGDRAYLQAIDSIWHNVVTKKIYVQGSVGAAGDGERFGENYELPNATAYNETCAAIANVYWNYRMFLLHGEAKYMDVLERTLYNGLLSGIGLDGKSFFYSNAMQIKHSSTHRDQERTRSGWFECSCCPTNMTRLLPSIPGYMYAQKKDSVYINLFASSSTTLTINSQAVTITQSNNYPWDGKLKITVKPQKSMKFPVLIRIPGWASNNVLPSDLYQFTSNSNYYPDVYLNGVMLQRDLYSVDKGYLVIAGMAWDKKGTEITIDLPMEVKRIASHKNIKDNSGKVALQRGPLVYCAEAADNEGKAANIILPGQASFSVENGPALLNGAKVIAASLPVVMVDAGGTQVSTVNKKVTMIPYYAWANRGQGEMIIWFPEKIKDLDLLPIAAF